MVGCFMNKSTFVSVVFATCLVALVLPGCGDDEETPCDKASAAWCACPMVSCMGRPESCTGPDLEWANCINAAPDPCTASCL